MGGGGGYLIAECARCRKKNYGKNIFSLVWNFDHENFSSSHFVIPGKKTEKKIQYLDISLLAVGPLITVPLKFGRYLILYIRRNET